MQPVLPVSESHSSSHRHAKRKKGAEENINAVAMRTMEQISADQIKLQKVHCQLSKQIEQLASLLGCPTTSDFPLLESSEIEVVEEPGAAKQARDMADSEQIKAHIETGLEEFKKGNYKKALRSFDAIIDIEEDLENVPNFPFLERAIANYEYVRRQEGLSRQEITQRSEIMLEDLSWIPKEDPRHVDALAWEAAIRFNLHGAKEPYTKVLSLLESVLQSNNQHILALHLRACIHLNLNEPGLALSLLDQVLTLMGPDHIDRAAALRDRGRAHFELKQLSAAEKDFSEAVDKEPKQLFGLHSLAVVRMKQKRYREAIGNFDKALSICPTDPLMLVQKAVAQLKSRPVTEKEFDEIKKVLLRRRSDDNGSYGYASRKLGAYLLEKKNWSDALFHLNKAVKLSDGKNAYKFSRRAVANFMLGNHSEAQSDLNKAKALKPESVFIKKWEGKILSGQDSPWPNQET